MTDKNDAGNIGNVLQKIRDGYKKIGVETDSCCGENCGCGDDSAASGKSCCSTPTDEASEGCGSNCNCKS